MSDINNADEKRLVDVNVPNLPVVVHAQYLKDFSFENPTAPESLKPSTARPEMDMNILLDAQKIEDGQNPDLYESTLNITVKAVREGKTVFIAEIVYGALVSLKGVPQENIRPILYIDVPQMIFPFARQVIATATGAGGFPPLLLNPVDFRGMYFSQAVQSAA